MQEQILIVGLIKKILRKSKRTYYQIYLSTKARRSGQSSSSYGKNSTAFISSSNGSATLSKRGYFTIWDDKNQPCSVNHPYFKDFFSDHGLEFSDFVQDPDVQEKGKLRKSPVFRCAPVETEKFEFSEPQVNSKTGKIIPGLFGVQMAEEVPLPTWADYSDAELMELAKFNDVKLGNTKARNSVIKKLESAGVTP